MNRSICLAISVPLLMSAGSLNAHADDWTGVYLGIGGGFAMAKHDIDAGASVGGVLPAAADFNAGLDGLGGDGSLFTIGGGADYQLNRSFLVGAFVDYDRVDAETSTSLGISSMGLDAAIQGEFKVRNQWAVGGRIGYLPTSRTLLFLSAAYTEVELSNLTLSAAVTGLGSETADVGRVDTLTGYLLGGGAEVKLTDAISIRGEYRLTELGGEDVQLAIPAAVAALADTSVRIDPTIQTARLTLNYRFGLGHSAHDAPEDPPADVATDGWTGVYLGIGGGLAMAKEETQLGGAIPPGILPVDLAFGTGIDGLGGDGGFFTLGAGADYQVHRNFLVGAFFDYDWLDVDTDASAGFGAAGLAANASAKFKLENQWAVGGRLGFLPTSRTLLFVSAGYTQADLSDTTFNASLTGLGAASGVLASVGTFSGYFLGGGAEVKLTDAISIKGEYRYSDLGSEDVTLLPDIAPEINEIVSTTMDPKIQTARVTLNYRFDWGQPAAAPLK